MKVEYESKVTWKTVTDYLRCSPMFFGKPRYDGVIINSTGGKCVFAQVILLFSIVINKKTYAVAYVQLLDEEISEHKQIDKDLCLYRVRARPRSKSIFIPIQSIVRGALLYNVPDDDYSEADEFFVVDTVDSDMFLRVPEIFGF